MAIKDDDGDVISKQILDWLTRIGAIAAALATVFAVFLSEEQAKPLAFAVAILLVAGSSVIFLYRRHRAARFKIADSLEPLALSAALRGLLPFEEGDQLPGRARDVQELYTLATSSMFRFGVLWGESGCGKTSVLRAGLIPKLRSDKFLPLYVGRPTKDPRAAIQAALEREATDIDADEDLKQLLRKAAPRGKRIIIILDQFEEFFLTNRTPRSRTNFTKWLGESITDKDLPVTFVIGIRADFFGQLQNLAPHVPEPTSPRSTYQLQNFDAEQAKQVFVAAAKADAIPFELELIEAVVSDLEVEEFILPAELQIVGTRLKRKNVLNLNRYEILGRARGILSSYINEETKQSASEPAARLILRLMCREEVVEKRSPIDLSLDEIIRGISEPEQAASANELINPEMIRTILNQFVAARIMIHTNDDKYNLIHDYLAPYVRTATEGTETNVERANRLLKRYVAEYSEDPKTRIPIGRVRWIQKHALAEVQRSDKAHELLKKSQRRFYATVAGIFALPLIVFLMMEGVLYAQDRLRGSWLLTDSLKGGQVSLIQENPNGSGDVYIVAYDDQGGASFYVWRNGYLELRSRNFIKSWPSAMAVTPLGIYITAYGTGIARSLDNGRTWELINRGLPSRGLTYIVTDPSNPKVIYVGTSDFRGALRSEDGGDSWNFYDYGGEIFGAQITVLSFSTSNGGMLLAGTADGRIIGHMLDSTEWTLLSNKASGSISAMSFSQSDPMNAYAGTNRGIVLWSQDGGLTWQSLGQIANQFNISCLAIDPHDPRRLLAATYGNGGTTVWESHDSGQTWSMMDRVGLPRVTIYSLALAGGSGDIFAGNADGLFVSADAAQTWENVALQGLTAAVQGLSVSENSSAPIYAYRNGSVYTNLTGDLKQWLDGKGLNAEFVRTVVADPDKPQVAYAGVLLLGEWSVFKTEDGGQTWQLTTRPNITPNVPDTTAIAIARQPNSNDAVIYVGTLGCGLFRSNDGGLSWETFGRSDCSQTANSGMPGDIFLLAVDASLTDKIYAAAGQQVFLSADGGKSWKSSHPPIGSPVRSLKTDSVRPNVVYLIAGIDGFWRSDDGGESWQRRGSQWFSNAELNTMQTIPGSSGGVIVSATNGAIWFSYDAGQTWQLKRENLAVSSITSIATSKALEGRVLIGTPHDGIGEFIPGRLFGDSAK